MNSRAGTSICLFGAYPVRVDGPAIYLQIEDSVRVDALELADVVHLRKIRGIGEVSEKRLKESGITKVSQVATMDKARPAAILGVSEVRTAEFIKAAKRLQLPGGGA